MVMLIHKNRSVFKLSGPDTFSFLQGVITNDMETLPEKEILYTVMLTPKGRFHFEFFLYRNPEEKKSLYLETPTAFAGDLLKKLSLFKLRSNVEIKDISQEVFVVTYHDESPDGELIFKDPRCEQLGYRGLYFGVLTERAREDESFYRSLCIDHCIPRAGFELLPEKTIPLEANLEELGALSFTKGCYLGQELTARTKHQGLVRKKLYTVGVDGDMIEEMLQKGVIIYGDDHKIGELLSYEQGKGIAKLRIEEVEEHKDLIYWQGILKETKTECCTIKYLPHK